MDNDNDYLLVTYMMTICENCDGEGGYYYCHNEYEHYQQCPQCNGSRYVRGEGERITIDDLPPATGDYNGN
jgi:DnaJ-class molecular chaperone